MDFKGYIISVFVIIVLYLMVDQFVCKPYKEYRCKLERVHSSRHVYLCWTDKDDYHFKDGYYLYFYNNSLDEYDLTGDIYLDETKKDVYNDFKKIECAMGRSFVGSINVDEAFYDLVKWNEAKVYFYEGYGDDELNFIGWMDKSEFYTMFDNIMCYDSGKRNNITIIWLSFLCCALGLIILCVIIRKIIRYSREDRF